MVLTFIYKEKKGLKGKLYKAFINKAFRYKNLIVGLQTEDTVYYELDTAKKVAAEERLAIIAGFFLILLFWITITLLALYTDDIVGIRRLTKSERKRMREKGK